MKKFFCMLLVALCALPTLLLTACNQETFEVDYDIDLANKPALEFLMPGSGRDASIYTSDPTVGVIAEQTGYDINYSQLPTANPMTSLNLNLFDRAQYNAIKVTKAQFNELAAKQALLDLTPVISHFGDNLKKKSIISDDSWKSVTYNGKIYGIPERSSSDNVDWGIVIRQDWLDTYAIRTPETKEELKEALKKIKEEKEKGTSAKFYPLTLDKDNAFVSAIAPAFDIYGEWTDVDGTLKYFYEMPKMKDYLDYMGGLHNEGLIDLAVATNDLSAAIGKFSSGNAAAIVMPWWSVPSVTVDMTSNGQASSETNALSKLGYIAGLKNSAGQIKTWRSSGVPYVTVVPHYMAKNAGYVVDHIDKKLEASTFTQIVLGTEDVHYYKDAQNNYWPIMDGNKFNEKNYAADYLTGSNEAIYPELWKARVRKNQSTLQAWSAFMTDVETRGVRNPMAMAPVLKTYSERKTAIELPVMDSILVSIFENKSSSQYNTVLAKWKSEGGTACSAEINSWYKA